MKRHFSIHIGIDRTFNFAPQLHPYVRYLRASACKSCTRHWTLDNNPCMERVRPFKSKTWKISSRIVCPYLHAPHTSMQMSPLLVRSVLCGTTLWWPNIDFDFLFVAKSRVKNWAVLLWCPAKHYSPTAQYTFQADGEMPTLRHGDRGLARRCGTEDDV